jgi:hypothetical protein
MVNCVDETSLSCDGEELRGYGHSIPVQMVATGDI